ncbi:MAG: hypothetical protein WC890_00855 [Candidatus Margulisiibacteriota bacterium]
MKKILFLSNGHGEDLVAAELIKKLSGQVEVYAMPLVGEGKAFADLNISVVGPQKSLPSGGFSLRNVLFLIKDLLAGLAVNTLAQLKILRSLRGKIDLTVAIGDIVPIIGALTVKAPFVFVGVNKSSYYKWFGYNYTPWEKQLLQSYAKKVFVRDKVTETDLTQHGIKVTSAEYVGNPLMDCIEKMTNSSTSSLYKLSREKSRDDETKTMTKQNNTVIGLLPGTRKDARLNLEDLAKVVNKINQLKEPNQQIKYLAATTLSDLPSGIERMPFAEVLATSDLIIGLSGTGNEQAAGSGIPVVSFYGRGSQYNQKFAEAQKQLLGDALSLVRDSNPSSVATEVWQLLCNAPKRQEMGKAGMERMGKSGAIKKIAEYLMQ